MYKNFNITEEEKNQIMQMHESNGYKTPMNEMFGMYWLTKIKIDSPEELTDEQKQEMARKFQSTFNGRIAVEFAPGEWYDAEKKIDDIDAYEEYVNDDVYKGSAKDGSAKEFKDKVQARNKDLVGKDSAHEFKYKSFDDYMGSEEDLNTRPLNEAKEALKADFKRFI